jgi:aldehyde dehydrogenase
MSFKYRESYGNFIGGKFVEPVSGKYFDNLSPVNGAVLCRMARSDEKDIELNGG